MTTVGLLLMWIAGASAHPDRGFSEGLAPIETGAPFASAQACLECHEEVVSDWRQSRHAQAHTNPLYQWGLQVEPSSFCINCHSPESEQAAEALGILPSKPHQPLATAATPLADEGVSCGSCHVREGRVLAPWGSPGKHAQDTAADLRDPAFCAGCHEFRFPHFEDGVVQLRDEKIQSTFSEWEAYNLAGGKGTCQSCHMPEGRHLFHGANDHDTLRGSLSVEVTRTGNGTTWVLRSVGVGHHLPSGDLFRHLTLEVREGDSWRVLHRIGRDFAHTVDEHGQPRKELIDDTSLRPGVPQQVTQSLPPQTPWRVVFHYGSTFDERHSGLPDDVLYATLWQGVTP